MMEPRHRPGAPVAGMRNGTQARCRRNGHSTLPYSLRAIRLDYELTVTSTYMPVWMVQMTRKVPVLGKVICVLLPA
jgi:hypothetical protein